MKLIYQQSLGFPVTQLFLVLPRTGACLDPADRRGLSRLTLRLLVTGAGGLGNAELNGRLERLGAAMGTSLSSDHISLRLTALTENLDAALDLLMLAIREPNFDGQEFTRLQEELTSAWVADREESKSLRAQEMYQWLTYRGQPQAFQADGTLEGLRAVTVDEARAHWTRLLEQGGPLLAVLSDLTEAEVRTRIVPRLQLPPPKSQPAHPWEGFHPPNGHGRRAILVPDPETNTDEVLLGGFTVSEQDPDWHIHRLIALMFGGDMNSRLFRIVRGEHGYSYGASCWYETASGRCPRNQVSPFSIYTFPSAEHSAAALPLVLRLYEELVAEGVTADELHRAQQALVNSYPFQKDTPQKKLGAAVDQALYGVTLDEENVHRAKLLAVTPAEVLRVLQATHRPGDVNLVLLGDPKRLEPVARALPGLTQLDVVNYP